MVSSLLSCLSSMRWGSSLQQAAYAALPAYVSVPYSSSSAVAVVGLQDKDMSKLKELGGVTGLCKTIKTDQQHGLDPASSGDASIDEHRRVFGSNTFPPVPQKNLFALCWENIKDPIILLLIAAALVSSLGRHSRRRDGSRAVCMDVCGLEAAASSYASCMLVYIYMKALARLQIDTGRRQLFVGQRTAVAAMYLIGVVLLHCCRCRQCLVRR